MNIETLLAIGGNAYLLGIIFYEAWTDTETIKEGAIVDHGRGFTFRSIMIAVTTGFVMVAINDGLNGWSWAMTTTLVYWLVYIAFFYWLLFDLVINALNRFPFDYVGTTAKTDRIVGKLGKRGGLIMLLIKLVGSVIFGHLFYTSII